MQYSLSVSKTALLAEITVEDSVVGISVTPDYGGMLQAVNRGSGSSLDEATVLDFARLFLIVAYEEDYDPQKIRASLDRYAHDVEHILGIGREPAGMLREQLFSWLELTLSFIGYAAHTMNTPV